MQPERFALVSSFGLLLAGCPSLRAYTCADVSDCDLRDGGVCMDGHCAYADVDCASGARWSSNAPDGGQCVPGTPVADDGGTTDGSGATQTGGETDSGDTTSGVECGSRILVRIDGAALAEENQLESYPLLVDLEHAALVGVGDVFFTDAEDAPLPFELEDFDDEIGALRAWVRLPLVDGQPLDIYLRFGDPAVVPDNDSTDVWAPWYVGVWHLHDALTGNDTDVVRDSTANEEHGRTKGSMTADRVVSTVIGAGFVFEGGDDAVEFEASFAGTLESYTISVWAQVDGDGTAEGPLFEKMNGHNLYPRCRKRLDVDGAMQCQMQHDGTVYLVRADAETVPRGEFWHVALVWDAEIGLFELYIDGVLERSETYPPGASTPGTSLPQIGRSNEHNSLTGMLDEFRVVDRALSADWIAADAKSQRDPSSVVLDVGAPEPVECR
jgi:hypothetical protein